MKKRLKTLVIGGAGYIGSHTVPLIADSGRQVTVLGRNPIARYKLPENVEYVSGDFGCLNLISNLLEEHQEVVYLAYGSVPKTSFENPMADLLQNLPPAIQLFSEAAIRGVKLLLVSSGGTVYGQASQLPISENHPTKPISPYGITKLSLENYAYLYAATHELNFICVRPSNAYGEGQRPFLGQGFVSTAIASAIRSIPIKIFGQYGTLRDYLYVSDIASGIVSALQYGHQYETYNIGSGIGMTNIDVINALEELISDIGNKIIIESLPERSFDVKANVLDSTKLKKHTGWKPRIDFMYGLHVTYEWLKIGGK